MITNIASFIVFAALLLFVYAYFGYPALLLLRRRGARADAGGSAWSTRPSST